MIDAQRLEPVDSDRIDAIRSPSASSRLPSAGVRPPDELAATSRFVIVDVRVAGGGIIHAALADRNADSRSGHEAERRGRESGVESRRVGIQPAADLFSSPVMNRRIARAWPANAVAAVRKRPLRLLPRHVQRGPRRGRDIAGVGGARPKLHRLGEVANILLDAGLIVIAAAGPDGQRDGNATDSCRGDRLLTIWLGDSMGSDRASDLQLATMDRSLRAHQGVRNRENRYEDRWIAERAMMPSS